MSVSRLGTGVADMVKQNVHVHRAARRMRRSVGRLAPPRRTPGIPGRVHFNDLMFTTVTTADAESYRERALNVIASVEETLAAAGKTFDDIERWLDFGCGYAGDPLPRRARPAERVFAGDVVREGVDFCRSEFGVHPVCSAPDFRSVRLGTFDFVYAVSVLKHLNERNSVAFLRLLGESSVPTALASSRVDLQVERESVTTSSRAVQRHLRPGLRGDARWLVKRGLPGISSRLATKLLTYNGALVAGHKYPSRL